MNALKEFQEIIGYQFTNSEYLKVALTHSSFSNENREKHIPFNERLEFLGDSVLSVVVSRYLFENFPKLPEGKLTKIRASVVCERSLWECAVNIELGKYMIFGKGEERMGGRTRMSILADAFEALIAAIYLDSSLETVREWILGQLYETIMEASRGKLFKDYKTDFQETAQKNGDVEIKYEVESESGPDHNKSFVVNVYLNGTLMGTGEGSSKKKAEQMAAQNALIQMKNKKVKQ